MGKYGSFMKGASVGLSKLGKEMMVVSLPSYLEHRRELNTGKNTHYSSPGTMST